MHYTVYKTTNLINGKVYIGTHQTDDPMDKYLGSGKNIQRAIAKYGEVNFRKEILFDFDNASEMFAKEAELATEEFCKRDDTYNICPGGQGGWGYLNSTGKNLVSEEKKPAAYRKMAESKKGKSYPNHSASLKRQYAEGRRQSKLDPFAFKGRKHTEETKKRIGAKASMRQSGEKNSQYGTMWITNGQSNARIKKTDAVPDGWHPGRVIEKVTSQR